MSTVSIMDDYVASIRLNYNLNIFEAEFAPIEPVPPNPEIDVFPTSRAMVVTEDVCVLIKRASKSINMAFDILFNNHKIEDGENQNFMVINAFSENYRNYDQYENGKFIVNKTYTYCCGKFYHASAVGSSGEFLTPYKTYIDNITEICLYYEDLYGKFIPTVTMPSSDDSSSDTSVPKITQFWNIYIAEFTGKINAQKEIFESLKSEFSSFEESVQSYIDLGQAMATAFAIGNGFVGSGKKTMVPYNNMGEIWKSHEGYFQLYSSEIENIYKLWLTSASETDKIYSVNATEYEYDSIRQNIFFSLILTYKDFWNQSNIIDEFISKFNENYQF